MRQSAQVGKRDETDARQTHQRQKTKPIYKTTHLSTALTLPSIQ
ncbi:MAG TPA: hypothetical protein V6D14_22940 [Coleofasciculaceae cyanobacterium]